MTVEAAFLVPVALVLLLALLQPGIVLYDKMVMQAAAGQGLRLLAVSDDSMADVCKNMVLSQLEPVPDIPVFRKGEWDIDICGDETSGHARVEVSVKIEPLPLVNAPLAAAGILDEDGCIGVKVAVESQTQPDWAISQGLDPASWPGQWD